MGNYVSEVRVGLTPVNLRGKIVRGYDTVTLLLRLLRLIELVECRVSTLLKLLGEMKLVA